MSEAPVLQLVQQGWSHSHATGAAPARPPDALSFEAVEAVEIVAPDLYSAALLVGYAAPSFLGEIVPGSAWIVRFEPSTPGGEWVVELLSLVERWLKSVPLPCAKVLNDDRRYLIRASSQGARILHLPSGPPTPRQVA
jgi:hypothetical protein